MTQLFTDAERADYLRLKARERKRDAQRARRANANKGQASLGALKRFAAYLPLYAEAGDVTLAELAGLAAMYDKAINVAVTRLMENDGWSWGMVADALGVSRTAVKKRFGGIVKSTRRPGAQPSQVR